jgi:putative membrane protein
MKFLGKALIITIINMLSVYVSTTVIPGFSASLNIRDLVIISLVLMGLNIIIKPVIKLLLSPIAWLTFGLSSLVINSGILFILDYLREDVIINGLVPLITGALLISFINLICQRLLLPK